MPEQLPGANVLTVIMQAPLELMGLATRQITEVVDVFGAGAQRLGAELAAPPELAALPMLPPLPGMAPAAAPPATLPPPPAASRALTRGGVRPKIIV